MSVSSGNTLENLAANYPPPACWSLRVLPPFHVGRLLSSASVATAPRAFHPGGRWTNFPIRPLSTFIGASSFGSSACIALMKWLFMAAAVDCLISNHRKRCSPSGTSASSTWVEPLFRQAEIDGDETRIDACEKAATVSFDGAWQVAHPAALRSAPTMHSKTQISS